MSKNIRMTAVSFVAFVMGLAVVMADTATVTVTAAGAGTYSAPINASGYIERIELKRVADGTSASVTARVATYDGTTAVETFAYEATMTTNYATKVFRPRVVGTGTTGTALTHGLTAVGTGTNVTQYVVVPYERMMIGGNTKLYVAASAGTNATVTATIYYEPIKK
jgi:hypothetical protein